jgi:carbon-monoxide dehydrogenase medium subunit
VRDFTYHRPASLDEAQALAAVDGAMLLAGGQTLLRDMKRGLSRPDSLVDIGALLSRRIALQNGAVWIGAGATHAEVGDSDILARHLPVLAGLVGHIGDPAVRNRGTLGGALAANEPAGDYPAACLALDATVHTSARDVAATEFFLGDRRTVLEPGEIVIGATFPIPRRAAYIKFLHPAARYAMVGVFVALQPERGARVAVAGAHISGAFRWRDAERVLSTAFTPERLQDTPLPLDDLAEDLFADKEYRAHLTAVLARRAVDLTKHGQQAVIVLSHGSRLGPRFGGDVRP